MTGFRVALQPHQFPQKPALSLFIGCIRCQWFPLIGILQHDMHEELQLKNGVCKHSMTTSQDLYELPFQIGVLRHSGSRRVDGATIVCIFRILRH